jgi:hypothetical protein
VRRARDQLQVTAAVAFVTPRPELWYLSQLFLSKRAAPSSVLRLHGAVTEYD